MVVILKKNEFMTPPKLQICVVKSLLSDAITGKAWVDSVNGVQTVSQNNGSIGRASYCANLKQ